MYEILAQLDMQREHFQGKVVLVTGGGRGIGGMSARFLAYLGAQVIVADVADTGQEVADAIIADGGDALFVPADVSSLSSLDALIDAGIKHYGKIDVLVNSATRTRQITAIAEFSADEWDDSYAVNLRGPTYLASKLLPGMLERKYGVILAFTTLEGGPLVGSYCAAKMGLQSMLLSLARELPPGGGVSSVVIVPGAVDTPLLHDIMGMLSQKTGVPVGAIKAGMVNPGYAGLVPVTHAAASCAYFIAHAADYHGHLVDGYLPHHKHGVIDIHKPSNSRNGEAPPESLIPSPDQIIGELAKNNALIEDRVKQRTEALTKERLQLLKRTLTDPLTELPNREMLGMALERIATEAGRNGTRFAVMYVDLDRFKPVNDTHGHHVGDLLLKGVAQRMQTLIRQTDLVARVGGDEFVVVLSHLHEVQDALRVAEKIRTVLDSPFELETCVVGISASIGVAVYPDHGDTASAVLEKADAAMYATKSGGRDGVRLFDNDCYGS